MPQISPMSWTYLIYYFLVLLLITKANFIFFEKKKVGYSNFFTKVMLKSWKW